MGAILGARVLGEFGDDPHRYADGKARRNYAATSPITRASGKKKVVAARFIHNDRLVDALNAQAFASLNASPGARALYDELRARGIEHNDALRRLANRLVGILHGCLEDPHPLRRGHRLGTPAKPPSIFRSGLTLKLLGCLSWVSWRTPGCPPVAGPVLPSARLPGAPGAAGVRPFPRPGTVTHASSVRPDLSVMYTRRKSAVRSPRRPACTTFWYR